MDPDDLEDDLRTEYDFDFSKAVRGKYYREYTRSGNLVVLEADVAAAFQRSKAVNAALRSMLEPAKRMESLTGESPPAPEKRVSADLKPRAELGPYSQRWAKWSKGHLITNKARQTHGLIP